MLENCVNSNLCKLIKILFIFWQQLHIIKWMQLHVFSLIGIDGGQYHQTVTESILGFGHVKDRAD